MSLSLGSSSCSSEYEQSLLKGISEKLLFPSKQFNDDSIYSWRNYGFALVDNLIPKDLIQACHKDMKDITNENKKKDPINNFGGILFPVPQSNHLNSLTIHHNILDCVKKLLNTDDILLTQSDAWSKVGKVINNNDNNSESDKTKNVNDSSDQRIHIDSHNHIMVVTPMWDKPVAVAIIVYLSDFVGGGTKVIPRYGKDKDYLYNYDIHQNQSTLWTPGGASEYIWINDRESAEKSLKEHSNEELIKFRSSLYANECSIHYNMGTVLFYRHDLWHRGTEINPSPSEDSQNIRFVLNLSFKRADCHYWGSWNQSFAYSMYSKSQFAERLLVSLSVEQRNVLGFPKPGDDYWNEWTLDQVYKRYKHLGFDITPYRQAYLESQHSNKNK